MTKNKQKIIFLTSHAAKGGTLGFLLMLQKHLLSRGYEAEIVALYRGRLEDADGSIRVLVHSEKLNLVSFALILIRFISICVARPPTFFFGVMPLANLMAAIGARLSSSLSIATHHSPYETHSRSLRFVDRVFGRLGMYDRIVSVSHAVKDSFKEHSHAYNKRLTVIINGVNARMPTKSAPETREQFGLADDRPIFLMVGRLSDQKNVLNAVKAFVGVPGAQLALVGDGPLRNEVEALILANNLSESVKLIGGVPKQDVINLLHASAVFVQVSLYEGHSLALLEAISAGSAIVVSDVPSQVEAIRLEGGQLAAITCDPSSAEDIGRAMKAAAFDNELIATLRSRVDLLKAKLRSESDMVDSYEETLKNLR